MGTKVAPKYATLTLGYLEYKLHQKLITLWGEELSEQINLNGKILGRLLYLMEWELWKIGDLPQNVRWDKS